MAGNSAIWRATSLGAEGSNSGDVIEFNQGALPTTTGYISTTEIEFDIEPAHNENSKGTIDEYQYVGLHSIPVIITGHIQTPSSTTLTNMIKKWAIETQVNGSFPKARFGLRLNDNPIVNLTPTSTRGYLLANIKLIRPVEFTGKLDFIARLVFVGDVGSSPYTW